MDMERIGAFLKVLRKEKGLTQGQLAERLFVSGRTVSRWETGTNMPDLSILIQMAEFYDVELKEILDGERKSEIMNQDLKETLSKVADYNKMEKEKAMTAGNAAFGSTFTICAAMILIQLIATGDLLIVAGETVALLVGGIVYMGVMLYNGIWETGSKFKSTPSKDLLTSAVCGGIFTAVLILTCIRLGAAPSQLLYMGILFFTGITITGFVVLRLLGYFSHRRKDENPDSIIK